MLALGLQLGGLQRVDCSLRLDLPPCNLGARVR
jgi:hypothetical protein